MAHRPAQAASLPFAEFLRTWWYLPITVWRDTFEDFYHPVFNFGCNVQDLDDEKRVLNEVGSYGKQISRILRVVDVLVEKLDKPLEPDEKVIVDEFRDYEARVAASLAESRGPQPEDLSLGYVQRLESALQTKRRSEDPQEFDRLIEMLRIVAQRNEREMLACNNTLSRAQALAKVRADLKAGHYDQVPQLEAEATKRSAKPARVLDQIGEGERRPQEVV